MENRTTTNVVQRVVSRHHTPLPVAEAERRRFIELAYRFVRCTEPKEQGRLKEELVRLVLER